MISLRKASFDDISELVRLRIDFMKEIQKISSSDIDSVVNKELYEYFERNMPDDNFIAWLAVDEERIIATSGLCFYKLPPSYKNTSGNVAYIMNMYTLPEFRNKGIASQLFEKMIWEAKNKGYNRLSLHATAMGRPLYAKFGFKGIDTEMVLNI